MKKRIEGLTVFWSAPRSQHIFKPSGDRIASSKIPTTFLYYTTIISLSVSFKKEDRLCFPDFECKYSNLFARSGRSVAGKRLADIYEEQAALAETVLRKVRREEELGLKSHADVVQTEAELADEPTGKLDSKNGREVMVLLSELNSEGTTIVMVTHSQKDAAVAQRTINLFDGQIVSDVKNEL